MEASQRIQELGARIETARLQVKKLPGIDFTKEEQAAQLKALKKQLVLKEVQFLLNYITSMNCLDFIIYF